MTPQEPHPSADDFAKAIGYLCIATARLDYGVALLVQELSGVDEKTTACILANDQLAKRCETAKRLILLKVSHSDWRDDATKALDVIINEIAPRRNRYIHDGWSFDAEGAQREDRSVKVSKTPHNGQTVTFNAKYSTPIDHLQEMIDVCEMAYTELTFIRRDYKVLKQTGQPLKALHLNRELSTYSFRGRIR